MSITKEKIYELKEQFGCNVFFETGFYKGHRFQEAIDCGFDKVICIELLKDFVDAGKIKFKNEIESKIATIHNDDSANMSLYLDDVLDDKILFWLDAHLDNGLISASTMPKSRCPVLHELEAMKRLNKRPIILIDDVRCIKSGDWGQSLLEINMNLIIAKLKEIDPEYKFTLIDGTIKNDILLAF
tara:strand:- start:3124 stop:3678 length:555 start_codon:yes stop_codon:yes gene_type:complete